MPKLPCPCGFSHDLTPVPDDALLLIPDRKLEEIFDRLYKYSKAPADSIDDLEKSIAEGQREFLKSGRVYECPDCGKLLRTQPGDTCKFRLYSEAK